MGSAEVGMSPLKDEDVFEPHSDAIYKAVYEASRDAEEILENLRRNLGRRGFAFLHDVVDLTKEGIEAVFQGDDYRVAEIDGKIKDLWDDFLNGRLPEHLSEQLAEEFDHDISGYSREQFIHQMGQEIAEFKFVAHLWPIIAGKETKKPLLPSAKKCRVPLQSWIGGLPDTVSECAKQMGRELENPISFDERIAWRKRYLHVMRQVTKRLHGLSHTPGNVINNSTWRGQGFHTTLGRISRLVGAIGGEYVELLDRKAANDDLLNRLKELKG